MKISRPHYSGLLLRGFVLTSSSDMSIGMIPSSTMSTGILPLSALPTGIMPSSATLTGMMLSSSDSDTHTAFPFSFLSCFLLYTCCHMFLSSSSLAGFTK